MKTSRKDPVRNNYAWQLFKEHFKTKNAAEIYKWLDKLKGKDKSCKKPPYPDILQIALQGGGAKTIGYKGGIQYLEETGRLRNLQRVGGTSGGCLVAFLVAMGFSMSECDVLMKKYQKDFLKVKKAYFGNKRAGWFANKIAGMVFSTSAYSNKPLKRFVSWICFSVLGNKNATFLDLHRARENNPRLKDLFCVMVSFNSNDLQKEICANFNTYPNMVIREAVLASMALVPAFPPVKVHEMIPDSKEASIIKKTLWGHAIDGGYKNNFPIEMFASEQYLPKGYELMTRKFENECQLHPVNLSTIGLSLKNKVEEFEESAVPVCQRIEKLKTHTLKFDGSQNTHVDQLLQGSTLDTMRAIHSYYLGPRKPEDQLKKERVHLGCVIPCYTEGVSFIDFALDGTHRSRLEKTYYQSTKVFFEAYRSLYLPYEGRYSYLERIKLKGKNKPKEAIDKVGALLFELYNEIEAQRDQALEKWKQNVKIKHLCFLIFKILKNASKFDQKEEQWLLEGLKMTDQLKKAIEKKTQQNKITYESVLNDKKIIKACQSLISKNTTESLNSFKVIIKGQLNYIIELVNLRELGCLQGLLVFAIAHLNVEAFEILIALLEEAFENRVQNDFKNTFNFSQTLNVTHQIPLGTHAILIHIEDASQEEKQRRILNQLIEKGWDLMSTDPYGFTIFHWAIKIKNHKIFQYLIEKAVEQNINLNKIVSPRKKLPLSMYIISTLGNESQFDCGGENFISHIFKSGIWSTVLEKGGSKCKGILAKESAAVTNQKLLPILFPESISEYNTILACHQNKTDGDRRKKILKNILSLKDAGKVKEYSYEQLVEMLTLYLGYGQNHTVLFNFVSRNQFELLKLIFDEILNQKGYDELYAILQKKENGKTPLYVACEKGYVNIVIYFRKTFDLSVNDAGPSTSPCALNIASKNGHGKVVYALIQSKPSALNISANRLSRVVCDETGKTAFHYLAQHSNPVFCDLFFDFYPRGIYFGDYTEHEQFWRTSSKLDRLKKTPFHYLVDNKSLNIFRKLKSLGENCIFRLYFDDLFNLFQVGINDLTLIEYAFEYNNQIFTLIQNNVRNKQKISLMIEKYKSLKASIKPELTSNVPQNNLMRSHSCPDFRLLVNSMKTLKI